MKATYNGLKQLFRSYYFRNSEGIVSGREYFELVFQLKSDQILENLEVQGDMEMVRYILRSSITLGLSYNEFLIAINRYRKKFAA